ncbi:MAG: hypothetical protein WCJ88_03225 [Actinomycetes bacterium]
MTIIGAFPSLRARNLEGLDVDLPAAFSGDRNIVVVAFLRNHQTLVDSWVPWFEQQAASDSGLRFYELPTIGRIWAPVRRFIDGGMAAAIREPVILQRTFTIYGDLDRVTGPLAIDDRTTIAVFCVDRTGQVLWRGAGGYSEQLGAELEAVLAESRLE